jgi:hypothetical protein
VEKPLYWLLPLLLPLTFFLSSRSAAEESAFVVVAVVVVCFRRHPERVRKLLYPIVFIADNMAVSDCVGTVQVIVQNSV